MVDAKQVQERRLQIVNMQRVASNVVAELVRLTDDRPALDSAAGEEARERFAVIAASSESASAAQFSSPSASSSAPESSLSLRSVSLPTSRLPSISE